MNSNNDYILLTMVFIIGCTTPKVVQNPTPTIQTCNTQAVVRDYTNLDACRFLLELQDGSRLIPVQLSDIEFLFSEGQVVKINYQVMKDVVTACLTAAIPVEISCIQQIKPGEKPGQVFMKRACNETDVPLAVSWMNKLIIRNKVTEVKKAYIGEKPYYAFYGNVYLSVYSCIGTLVCESPLKAKESSCQAKLNNMSDLKSIWALK